MILILFWVIFGTLVGWISAMIDESQSNETTYKYISYGIIGALGGGSLFALFDKTSEFLVTFNSVIFPVLGSITAIALIKRFSRQSN